MNHPVTIYYHADCLDGFAAAYAAWRRFGEAAHYRPMHHGDSWLADDVAGRQVFILDFSFPPAILEAMAAQATRVVQLDHHVSARRDWLAVLNTNEGATCYNAPDRPLTVVFDLEKSGTRLAWEHFQPDEPLPRLLACIEDQDLWRFTLDETRPLCRALRMEPFSFATWDALVRTCEDADSPAYRQLLVGGEAIERQLQAEVRRLAEGGLPCPARLRGEPIDALQAVRHGLPVITDGEQSWQAVTGLAANANMVFASELGNLLAERSSSFGLTWQLTADGLAKVSLRSKGDFDVSVIATRYGGGGHRNAAGFRLPAQQLLAEVLAMVPRKGLEPPRISTPEPKSGASTNFATWASGAHSSTD